MVFNRFCILHHSRYFSAVSVRLHILEKLIYKSIQQQLHMGPKNNSVFIIEKCADIINDSSRSFEGWTC